MTLDDYQHLRFERPKPGVLLITIDRPAKYNATNVVLHRELSEVWRDVDRDEDTSVAVITGAGDAFSAGGDLDMIEADLGNFDRVALLSEEIADIVYNITECRKPVISAINGVAVGAGLAVALLADISIIAEEARITDGHSRLGLAAGDHAAIIWPLLCGMAKAKYYLLTADFLDGREAERIGLVSRCVPRAELMDVALDIAARLADGPRQALRWTKRSLNLWLRNAAPVFEASMAYELLGLFSDDVREGTRAIRERRPPRFG